MRSDARAVENAPGNAYRATEQGFERGEENVERAGQNVEQGFKDAPSDIGGALKSAASWIGSKVGGAENEGRRAEGEVDRFGQGVEDRGRRAEGDVDRFGEGVGNSYEQGEQQGRQQGW